MGRSDTTYHQVIANDVPEATISIENQSADAPTTLRANVTNDRGNATVTWMFPDGTERTGETVRHTFGAGEHEVLIRVEDSFGAVSETRERIAIGPANAAPSPTGHIFGVDLTHIWMSLVGVLGGLGVLLLARRLPWGVLSPRRYYGPDIVSADGAYIDISTGCFGLSTLEVRDSKESLQELSIEIVDADARPIVSKRIEFDGEAQYTAAPEELLVPPSVELSLETGYAIRLEAVGAGGRRTTTNIVDVSYESSPGGRRLQTPVAPVSMTLDRLQAGD
jgi:hypothetical protein